LNNIKMSVRDRIECAGVKSFSFHDCLCVCLLVGFLVKG
jgi:hypothetical protein